MMSPHENNIIDMLVFNNDRTATIYLIHVAISATLYLLRVHTEISWSHGTIRGKVRNGTSQ